MVNAAALGDSVAVWLPLRAVLTGWRPGSDDHGWEVEYRQMLSVVHRDNTLRLAHELSLGTQTDPIQLGDDGRVWDGHHRLTALWYLGDFDRLVWCELSGRHLTGVRP